MKPAFKSFLAVQMLLLFAACEDGFEFQRGPLATATQHYFPFYTSATNLSPLGCTPSLQRVKWPKFEITEIAQDLISCFPVGELMIASPNFSQASTLDGDVVFSTAVSDIELGINSGIRHAYYWNHENGQIQRISKGLLGVEPNGDVDFPVVSGDGRYVCYNSMATNVVTGDTNGVYDVFLYDSKNNTTIRVQDGVNQPNGQSRMCSISRDGKFLTFSSDATNLVTGDSNSVADVFVYDIVNQTLERVSISSNEDQVTERAEYPFISGTGRFVTFVSDQLDGDADNSGDVFLRDRQLGTTYKITEAFNGAQIDNLVYHPTVDDSGRFIAFNTLASNILSSPSTKPYNYLYDRKNDTTIVITSALTGGYANDSGFTPNVSSDGKYVYHISYGTDLVSDTIAFSAMYVYDISLGKNYLVSRKADGTPANAESAVEY